MYDVDRYLFCGMFDPEKYVWCSSISNNKVEVLLINIDSCNPLQEPGETTSTHSLLL